ncbi:hypothetical protein M0802_000906 [Mischocyttarus mexicanus]|nr:hypothetical protein M0802_000906 [Mischocyttarus mexicanus]
MELVQNLANKRHKPAATAAQHPSDFISFALDALSAVARPRSSQQRRYIGVTCCVLTEIGGRHQLIRDNSRTLLSGHNKDCQSRSIKEKDRGNAYRSVDQYQTTQHQ